MQKITFVLLIALAIVQAKRIKEPSAAFLAKHNLQQSQSIGPEGRVLGGTNAEIGFAPYQFSLQGMFGEHICGGAVISTKYGITAAHCVEGFNPKYLRIITGTNKWQEPGAIYEVEEYWVHCNFDEPYFANDIALARVIDEIKMDALTQPIPLPTRPMEEGDEVILTGWGSTELFGELAENLQKVYLKYMKHKRCVSLIGENEGVDVGHMCTFTKEGEGSCHGDSGGPLISNGKLVGLVNWGRPCAIGLPDMHANVYYYSDWIKRTMKGCRQCHCYASNYPTPPPDLQ